VTTENAPKPELAERAAAAKGRRFHEIGIALAGLTAYEQMIIARVLLYDRLYYHHKIRAAESMLRRLVRLAEEEREKPYSLTELFHDIGDDAFIDILGGRVVCPAVPSGGPRSAELSDALHHREVYYRAFSFAPRFLVVSSGLSRDEAKETTAMLWSDILEDATTAGTRRRLEEEIHATAIEVAEQIEDLRESAATLGPEHILVDLPANRVVAGGGDILTRTEKGAIGTPYLFFDPDRWSQAYEHQKQCGFVFAPRRFVPLVALAARLLFYNRYGVAFALEAERAAKTVGVVKRSWFEDLVGAGLCPPAFLESLDKPKPTLLRVEPDRLQLPSKWVE